MKKFFKESFNIENKGCRQIRQHYPSYPSQNGPCPKDECCIEDEKEMCEEETFDASQIRYRISCGDTSKLRNIGIEKGARLDFILEQLWEKVEDIGFVETPRVPNKPLINTFQAVISDLYNVLERQQKEINELKKQLEK